MQLKNLLNYGSKLLKYKITPQDVFITSNKDACMPRIER